MSFNCHLVRKLSYFQLVSKGFRNIEKVSIGVCKPPPHKARMAGLSPKDPWLLCLVNILECGFVFIVFIVFSFTLTFYL